MQVIPAESVEHAYNQAVYLFGTQLAEETTSRNGLVKQIECPVTTAYYNPLKRVLLNKWRDANPFFHLFEAMWMLGGRNDVEFLNHFTQNMGQFSDDGVTLHGAYGWRWREHFKDDQLERAISALRANSADRRVVLSMWDPYIDPQVAELGGKDVPCNTQIYFNVKRGCLDMTVTNRSNDAIWGAYGANAVHMSILHEYMALATDLPMGTYYQVSNNLHVYERHFELLDRSRLSPDPYAEGMLFHGIEHVPLFHPVNRPVFDRDLGRFLGDPYRTIYESQYFSNVIQPLAAAHKEYKKGNIPGVLASLERCQAKDWKFAAVQWVGRRHGAYLASQTNDAT